MEAHEADVQAGLLARAREAIQRAVVINDTSRVLTEVSAALRDGMLTTRCAWCSRYLARDEWVRVTHAIPFAERAKVSHSICPDCVAALRESGMSV